jgi:hypothetical protein
MRAEVFVPQVVALEAEPTEDLGYQPHEPAVAATVGTQLESTTPSGRAKRELVTF